MFCDYNNAYFNINIKCYYFYVSTFYYNDQFFDNIKFGKIFNNIIINQSVYDNTSLAKCLDLGSIPLVNNFRRVYQLKISFKHGSL